MEAQKLNDAEINVISSMGISDPQAAWDFSVNEFPEYDLGLVIARAVILSEQ